ncbi:hypothetical protein L596_005382 [Steinernema carpocapsae]|uniref:Uncharacterized protein n=1 Tax=Steinernema carpocapsae TaxID=34508 RepID=A0A4U8UZ32_STECR|nr:hypothetical protein L596_005382 [Steinernema carpocapsae]
MHPSLIPTVPRTAQSNLISVRQIAENATKCRRYRNIFGSAINEDNVEVQDAPFSDRGNPKLRLRLQHLGRDDSYDLLDQFLSAFVFMAHDSHVSKVFTPQEWVRGFLRSSATFPEALKTDCELEKLIALLIFVKREFDISSKKRATEREPSVVSLVAYFSFCCLISCALAGSVFSRESERRPITRTVPLRLNRGTVGRVSLIASLEKMNFCPAKDLPLFNLSQLVQASEFLRSLSDKLGSTPFCSSTCTAFLLIYSKRNKRIVSGFIVLSMSQRKCL